ncbi:hypothetical protein [Actinokineospora enzanensis]|uniref:hypothetical protein n=1 Tax=Actinokineospora enzanensis TaxID=155975 RepID=UPI00037DD7B6|nr:hypothetical protein [Actinokineospora enzanensis]
MPRRHRKDPSQDARPLGGGLFDQRVESASDGDWIVRRIPAAQATKTYRCPGCDHEIRPGVAHVVVWSAEEHGTVEDRRHWHPACWSARSRRGPTPKRR